MRHQFFAIVSLHLVGSLLLHSSTAPNEDIGDCISGGACKDLGGDCLTCDFNTSCIYGQEDTVRCRAKESVECSVSATWLLSIDTASYLLCLKHIFYSRDLECFKRRSPVSTATSRTCRNRCARTTQVVASWQQCRSTCKSTAPCRKNSCV